MTVRISAGAVTSRRSPLSSRASLNDHLHNVERYDLPSLTNSIFDLARSLPTDATLNVPVSWLLSLPSAPNERHAKLPAQASLPSGTPLITVAEAAARLGVEPSWIYRHRSELPFAVRVGSRALRADPEKLDRWVARSGGR